MIIKFDSEIRQTEVEVTVNDCQNVSHIELNISALTLFLYSKASVLRQSSFLMIEMYFFLFTN